MLEMVAASLWLLEIIIARKNENTAVTQTLLRGVVCTLRTPVNQSDGERQMSNASVERWMSCWDLHIPGKCFYISIFFYIPIASNSVPVLWKQGVW